MEPTQIVLLQTPPGEISIHQSPPDDEAKLVKLWLHGLSRHTRRAYTRDLKLFRQFAPQPLDQITLVDVQAFADQLNALPLCAGSRHRILAGVKSFFAYAHRLGLLKANVAAPLRLPSGKDTLNERILSEDEVSRLIEACNQGMTPRRDRLIAEMLYYCGLRVSELVGFTGRDLQPRSTGAQVTVLGKGNKTRAVLVPDFVWDGLFYETAPDPDRKCFPLCTTQIWRIIRAAAQRAGIQKPVSPHWLRHCHCSHALERGADLSLIQATVGHSNVATTSKYLHARPDRSSSSFLKRPDLTQRRGGAEKNGI